MRRRAVIVVLTSGFVVACGLDVVGALVPDDTVADASPRGGKDGSLSSPDDSGISDGGVVTADTDADASPCGSMVLVPQDAGFYCIDPTEVTEAHYGSFLAADASVTWPQACSAKNELRAGSSRGPSRPVANVDWCDAWAFCKWAGKRLCSTEEWEQACNGGSGTTYPYGDTFDASVCNGGGSQNDSVDVGSLPGCHGPLPGLFDMSGNADEWADGCLTDLSLIDLCPTHGGDWSDDPPSELTCTSTQRRTRNSTAEFLGFRCCK